MHAHPQMRVSKALLGLLTYKSLWTLVPMARSSRITLFLPSLLLGPEAGPGRNSLQNPFHQEGEGSRFLKVLLF